MSEVSVNLYIRFLFLLARRCLPFKRIDIFDSCRTFFRVNLLDLDVNFHMNNGRYLSIMDLGRVDLMVKAGVFWKLVKNGYYPVVVSESIRFKKSLEPFQKFELVTTLESWDEKDFYLSQKFQIQDEILAEGYIKGRFKRRGKGSVPTAELFNIIGKNYEGPRMSDLAKLQRALEEHLIPKNSDTSIRGNVSL